MGAHILAVVPICAPARHSRRDLPLTLRSECGLCSLRGLGVAGATALVRRACRVRPVCAAAQEGRASTTLREKALR